MHVHSAQEVPIIDGYEVDGRLGQGGMGVVWSAREKSTGRRVAIKTLQRIDGPDILRLKREFRMLANIVHPNVVQLHRLGFSGQDWFFTMELIVGRELLDYLQVERWRPSAPPVDGDVPTVLAELEIPPQRSAAPNDTFNELQTRATFLQLARGICALHASGILHCDIKPSNVLVDEGGRVVVLDFGVLRCFGRDDAFHADDGVIAGTPEYMSPEQAAGQTIGPASDWYAFGVVLYEALTGTLPFTGTRGTVMRAKHARTPPTPGTYRPSLTRDLEGLCMDLLESIPDRRPSGAEVIRRLDPGTSTTANADLRTSLAQFEGREDELAQLSAAWRMASATEPVLVLVTGESGIGKTALVQCFLERAMREADVVVLRGCCYERESVPYKAFDPIIDEVSRFLQRLPDREVAALLPRDVCDLGRIFPVLRGVRAIAAARGRRTKDIDVVEFRRRALCALKELFARLADTRRFIISIDDLQWGDVDSVRLLIELLQPPDGPALLVIACAQDESRANSAAITELTTHCGLAMLGERVRTLALQRLSERDTKMLTVALLGSSGSERIAAGIAKESGGHPLFVYELAHHARTLPSAEDDRSLTLEEALQHRISRLPQAARLLLEIIAVAGRPISQALLLHGTDVHARHDRAWGVLVNARLVRVLGEASDALECSHDRVRRAVLARMTDVRVRECHHLLACAYEEVGATDPETLFEHYRGAGDRDRAREHLLTSARSATQALAFSRAARLYRMAFDLAPCEERGDIGRALAESLAHAGAGVDAAEVYLTTAEHASGAEAIELKRLAAQYFLTSGDLPRGLVLLRDVLNTVGLEYPENSASTLLRLATNRTRIRFRSLHFRERCAAEISPVALTRTDVCFSAAVGLALTDPFRAAAFSAQHLYLTLKLGDPVRVARGLTFEMAMAPGAGAEGMRWARRALPVAERLAELHGDVYHRGLFLLAQAHVTYLSGEWSAAAEWAARAEKLLRTCHREDVRWALLAGNTIATIALVVAGDLAAVNNRLPAVLVEARQRGDVHGTALLAYPRVLCELAAGRVEVARELSTDAACCTDDSGFHLRDFTALHCTLFVDRYLGAHEQSWKRFVTAWPALVASKLLAINIVRITALAERASAALAARSDTDARERMRVARDCIGRLTRERLPHARALADLLRARMLHERGESAHAAAMLTETSRAFAWAGMSLYADCTRRFAGVLKAGDLGALLVAEADASLIAHGVREPQRFAAMIAPGFMSL